MPKLSKLSEAIKKIRAKINTVSEPSYVSQDKVRIQRELKYTEHIQERIKQKTRGGIYGNKK